MSTLERAIEIAKAAHDGQKNKDGTPYITHPLKLMESMDSTDEKIAAILHDVVEDSDVTIEDLRAEGFSETILSVVDTLTHKPDESYSDYIKRVAGNPMTRKIKTADLKDNMDQRRIPNPTEEDISRIKKYEEAYKVIRSAKNTYTVYVDDNYHYMDESERYKQGVYHSCEEAVAVCKRIVEDSLPESVEPGKTEDDYYAGYTMFGEDPWISCDEKPCTCNFSAWTYARERIREMFTQAKEGDSTGTRQREKK